MKQLKDGDNLFIIKATPSPKPTGMLGGKLTPIGQYANKVEIKKKIKDETIIFTIKVLEDADLAYIIPYIAEYDDGNLMHLEL